MKAILSLAAGLLVSTSLAAHSETVLLSMKGPGSGNPFWAAVQAGAEAKAKELGVDLVVLAPPEESDVQSQISQVEDQLAKKIDAIAIAPTDPNALAPVVDQAKKQGVGVVFIDTKGINRRHDLHRHQQRSRRRARRRLHLQERAEGQRGRDPAGHHHPVDGPGARRRLEEGPDRLRPQRRRRAAGGLGYRQGAVGDGEHHHRPSQHQGGLRLQRQHGARRRPGAQVGEHARQGDGRRLRRQSRTPRPPSSPATWPLRWRKRRRTWARSASRTRSRSRRARRSTR